MEVDVGYSLCFKWEGLAVGPLGDRRVSMVVMFFFLFLNCTSSRTMMRHQTFSKHNVHHIFMT